MAHLSTIQAFLEPKEIAFCGVSRNKKKFGRVVYDSLKEKGFNVFPVNPNADEIDGEKCFHDVSELPDSVKKMFIVTPKDQTKDLIEKASEKGIDMIWIQQSSETPESIELAEQKNIDLIYKECIMKFAEPVTGVHKFHRVISKLFGTYPK